MALLFNDATPDYLVPASTPVTAPPFTMACWFKTDAFVNQELMSIVNSGSPTDHYEMRLRDPGDNDLFALTHDGASSFAQTTNSYTLNNWHHGCAVFGAVNSRAAYIDGPTGKGTNAGSRTPTGINLVSIGMLRDSSPSFPFSGLIAEAAIWNVALTDAEVAMLALGYSPLAVRPSGLVLYRRMIRDEDVSIVGGLSFSVGGSPVVAEHPRVIDGYPASLVSTPLSIPVAMRSYRNRRAG